MNSTASKLLGSTSVVGKSISVQIEDLSCLLRIFKEREENIVKLFKIVLLFKSSAVQRNKIRLHNLSLRFSKFEEVQTKNENIVINKYINSKMSQVPRGILEEFIDQINKNYANTKDRLIAIGVSEKHIEQLAKEIKTEEVFGQLSRDTSITLDSFLLFLAENSRERFSDMQKASLESQEMYMKAPQIPEILQNEVFESLEDSLQPKPAETAQYYLLKTLVNAHPELVENQKEILVNNSIKRTNKFPKTDLAICDLLQPNLVMNENGQFLYQTSTSFNDKKPNRIQTSERPKTTNEMRNSKNRFSRDKIIQSRGKENENTIQNQPSIETLSLNIISLSNPKPQQKPFKKPSTAEKKESSISKQGPIEKKSSSSDIFKSCVIQADKASNYHENEAKDLQIALAEKLYSQLLASNTTTKKTLNRYQSDYNAYCQRQKEQIDRASLTSLDEEIKEKSVDYRGSLNYLDSTYQCSYKSIETHSYDEDKLGLLGRYSAEKQIKSTPKSEIKFFNESQPSPQMKKSSNSSSKKKGSRKYFALPKLDILENLCLDRPHLDIIKNCPKRVIVSSVKTAKRLSKKSKSRKTSEIDARKTIRPSSTMQRIGGSTSSESQSLFRKSLNINATISLQDLPLRAQSPFDLAFQQIGEISLENKSFTNSASLKSLVSLQKQAKQANVLSQSRKKIAVKC